MAAEALRTLKAEALPGEFDMVASQARALREWFRGFVVARAGRSSGPLTCVSWSRSTACSLATNDSMRLWPAPKEMAPYRDALRGDGDRPSRFFCRSAWSSLNSYVKISLLM